MGFATFDNQDFKEQHPREGWARHRGQADYQVCL